MSHFATSDFWDLYLKLPIEVQNLADKNFELLKQNPLHPSLNYKKNNNYRSVIIGLFYRALAIETDENIIWFWIGNHQDYDKLLKN